MNTPSPSPDPPAPPGNGNGDPFGPLISFALLLGALFYLGGIVYAGVESYRSDDEPDLNQFLHYAVVTIGAALGTHFGAVLGISRVKGGGGGGGILGVSAARFTTGSGLSGTSSGLQIAAAYFYFGALVVAVAAWLFDGFSGDSADLLRTLGFDLIGVIVGIGAVALSIPKE